MSRIFTSSEMIQLIDKYDYVIKFGVKDDIIKEMSSEFSKEDIDEFINLITQIHPEAVKALLRDYRQQKERIKDE